MRYIQELEHKVQVLQTEATTLSAQLTMLQVCFANCKVAVYFDLTHYYDHLVTLALMRLFTEGLHWTSHSEQ